MDWISDWTRARWFIPVEPCRLASSPVRIRWSFGTRISRSWEPSSTWTGCFQLLNRVPHSFISDPDPRCMGSPGSGRIGNQNGSGAGSCSHRWAKRIINPYFQKCCFTFADVFLNCFQTASNKIKKD